MHLRNHLYRRIGEEDRLKSQRSTVEESQVSLEELGRRGKKLWVENHDISLREYVWKTRSVEEQLRQSKAITQRRGVACIVRGGGRGIGRGVGKRGTIERKERRQPPPLSLSPFRRGGKIRRVRRQPSRFLGHPSLPYPIYTYPYGVPVPVLEYGNSQNVLPFGNMLHGCTSIVPYHPRVRPSLVHEGQNFRQTVYRRRTSPETSILTLGIRRDSAHSQPKF